MNKLSFKLSELRISCLASIKKLVRLKKKKNPGGLSCFCPVHKHLDKFLKISGLCTEFFQIQERQYKIVVNSRGLRSQITWD